jgi:hypothetical protein
MSTGLQLPPRVVSVAICAQRNLSPFANAAFLPRDPKAGTLKKIHRAGGRRAHQARRGGTKMGVSHGRLHALRIAGIAGYLAHA